MVLLPEDTTMTLTELRQMAARQQQQIEAQQQLLVAKEQRLKFLKQQEARHHSMSDHQLDTACLQNLRDKIETKELKLRQLRALRSQVEQQKTNNENLGTELDSIRALFSEKEKELNLAVNKVEELTRQLDEVRNNNRKNRIVSSSATELENLRRELLYRTKLSEQQNNYICQQREDIALRHQDIAVLDKKINDLTQRLHRKLLLNEQLASQLHSATLTRNYSSGPNTLFNTSTVMAVEPIPREIIEPEQTRDDMAAKLSHKGDLGEFGLTKNDPKYQTLPYNTKFTLKGKAEDCTSSSADDDSSPNSLDSMSSNNNCNNKRGPPLSVLKPSNNMGNLAPRPFGSSSNVLSKVIPQQVTVKIEDNTTDCLDNENRCKSNSQEPILQNQNDSTNNNVVISTVTSESKPLPDNIKEKPKTENLRFVKPAIPPKPALPVKPMIFNQVASSKRKDHKEKDVVNAALSVLQNKSSKNDRNAVRYQSSKENTQDAPTMKSKIATYFQKTSSKNDSNSHHEPSKPETPDLTESPKRKSTIGQLPIKPKPLTIRKTPGLEPPKLKVQPVINTNFNRKPTELSNTKPYQSPSTEGSQDNSSKLLEKSEVGNIPVVEVAPLKNESVNNLLEKGNSWMEEHSHSVSKDNEAERDEVDRAVLNKNTESIEPISKTLELVAEPEGVEVCHSAALRRMRKGNLKGENSSRSCRRVSFDPLALLLDAALEGELELVKKTASEVPNPSAANDEGITALHNAICAGHSEVVTFLVEFGCDVNAQDSDGWTPLHCAASCNNLPMVKFLVERGACVFATTLSDHETAAEKCEEDEEGFDGCSEYLYSLQENLGVMNNGIVHAVYDYDVQNADELGFKDGDMLTVLRKGDDEESEWWWSRLLDEEGYIPRNLLGLYPRVTGKKEESSKPDN